MRVLIAGAGIGGLTAALSLHAAGIVDVTVLEAADELRPLGVGINLLPHAVRELTELGLGDRIAAIGVPTAELAYFNRFGQAIWSEPRGVAAGYTWPQFSVHRGGFQMLLLEAVHERLGPDAVRTSSAVTHSEDLDGNRVRVHTADGTTHDADLLVAADGIRSAVRASLFPDEGPPPWNGLVLWRGTTRAQPFLTGASMIMAGDGNEKFVAYPLTTSPDPQDGTVLVNWIAERPLESDPPALGDWNRPVDVAEILRHFGHWTFDWLDVPGIVAGAASVYEYPMVDREPLPRWTHGRTTLLGDAAHAMYPIGSNGASQAVIDARVLAYHLATAADTDAGLAAYEAERRPATTAIQTANRGMGPEIVMKTVHERAPHGFDDIDTVLSLAEREDVASAYKRTAGFDPAALNARTSYSVEHTAELPR